MTVTPRDSEGRPADFTPNGCGHTFAVSRQKKKKRKSTAQGVHHVHDRFMSGGVCMGERNKGGAVW